MTAANKTRRAVMNLAWGSKRSDPTRAFADCLRGAWAFTKRIAKTATKFARQLHGGVRIDFSRSLLRSPASNRYGMGTMADRHAGQSISRVGR